MNTCTELNALSKCNVNNQIRLLNLLRQHVVPHVHLTGRVFRTYGSTHAFENEGKNPLFGTIHAQNDKLRQVDFSRETTMMRMLGTTQPLPVTCSYTAFVPIMLTSPRAFSRRCREIAKGNELSAALRDCGINTFEEFYYTFRAKGRDLTDQEFDVCAADVHLTDYPSKKQVIQLKLLAIESKEIFEKSQADATTRQRPWGAPPPLWRKRQTGPESSTPVGDRPQSESGEASKVPVRLTPSCKDDHGQCIPSRQEDAEQNVSSGVASSSAQPLPFTSDNEELVAAVKMLRECEQMEDLKLETLQHKLTSSTSLGFILDCVKGSVITISGTPGIGKSTLAVNVCKALGMTKIATTSKNFWLFGRASAPHCQIWVHYNDSFTRPMGRLTGTDFLSLCHQSPLGMSTTMGPLFGRPSYL